MAEVREAVTEEEVAATYPVMRALRPHHPEDGYPGRVRRMRESGYRLAAVIEEGEARAVAGFRVQEFLAWGRLLYVDDLVTAEESRSRGYGKLLLDWLAGKARRESCEQLHSTPACNARRLTAATSGRAWASPASTSQGRSMFRDGVSFTYGA